MITLFNINNYQIDTSELGNLLHGKIVEEFEQAFAEYVGAKYACFANSASSLLYLSLKGLNTTIRIPSIMPPVVPNVIVNSGNKIEFYDDVDWVGNMYQLHPGIWDSAQMVARNQYQTFSNCDNDTMIFSFYPTKPVGSCDGGMIVSNNQHIIDNFKAMVLNGTKASKNAWDRKQIMLGYKMHGNSIQAKIAYENLKELDQKNKTLKEIRLAFNESLGYNNKSYHLYRIRVKDNQKFLKSMLDAGIQCGIHYSAFHKNYLIKNMVNYKEMPKSELEEKQTVSIPFHEKLTPNNVEYIIDNIRKLND
tara:strand:- start:206 stop:1123 length:918 start_codon:yes stop_codon:yes gene_type:complete